MNRGILDNILFVDIETVSIHENITGLSDRMRELWEKKFNYMKEGGRDPAEIYEEKAALYAEFGRIIVIGLGFFTEMEGRTVLRLKALSNDSEQNLLEEFIDILRKFDPEHMKLCAHNGRNFDFPYLSRRILINGLKLPEVLRLSGKKPWEINHLDTMEMWRFGDYRHYTSLDLLAAIFDIPTSKGEMDGSQVGQAFHGQNNLEGIARYCLSDVEVTARIFLHLTEQKVENFDVMRIDE